MARRDPGEELSHSDGADRPAVAPVRIPVDPALRVALVLPDLDGAGAQRVMLDLAAGMIERGVEVDVVAVRASGALTAGVPDGAHVVDLRARRAVTALRPLVRYLRAQRPDAVVSCLNHVNLVTVASACVARTGARVMVTQHNHLSTATPRKATRRARAMPAMLRIGFRYADRIVAVSAGVADDLAATIGIDRDAYRRDLQPRRLRALAPGRRRTARGAMARRRRAKVARGRPPH